MAKPLKQRLESLDALRGFDMFWIIGGAGLFTSLVTLLGLPDSWVSAINVQFTHVSWEGFRFFDLIFPLFVFLSGVAVPFSVLAKKERGVSVSRLQWGIAKRTLVLVGIGLSFSVFRFEAEMVRLYTVLYLIGMAYLIGASVALHVTSPKRLLAVASALLVVYHLALMYCPFPGKGAEITAAGNLAAWLDRSLVPTNLYRTEYDPEGTIRVIPAGALCLIGVIAGAWLRQLKNWSWKSVGGLALAGFVCLGIGGLWSLSFPIIKDLWSPSFILWSAGWSLLLLALFHALLDVLRWKWFGFLLVPIGMNAIVIYASQWYLPWTGVRDFFFAGMARSTGDENVAAFVLALGLVGVQWLVLYWLHRRRIHIRV